MTCTGMFIAVVFIIALNWKQPQISIYWWPDKHIAVDPFLGTTNYLAIKRKELFISRTHGWITNVLGRVKAANPKGLHIIWFYSQHSGKGKSAVTDNRLVIAWGWGTERRINCKGTGGKLGGNSDGNILNLDCSGGFIGIHLCQNSSNCTLSKREVNCTNYILMKLYLNIFLNIFKCSRIKCGLQLIMIYQ